jgi:lipopolysaccharide transport system permease protein
MSSAGTMQRNVWRPLWELPRRSELIWSLAKRELLSRYKGSVLGIFWAVVTPVVMIAIFTFIFAGIFGARFGNSNSHWTYALYLFCGLIPWNMFQDTLQQSSTTIVNHSNLVKRVIFPLETLPVAQAFSAVGNQLFASIALLLAVVVIEHRLALTFLWLPVLLIPQLLIAIGGGWLLASLGVFLRDIVQGVSLVLTAWLYLTPIIYPESIVPPRFSRVIQLNPFTALVRNYRRIFLENQNPDWAGLGYFTIIALLVFFCGYWWFARTRKNFADVI